MKRCFSLILIGCILVSILCIPINASSSYVSGFDSETLGEISASNFFSDINNVRITERELPFQINVISNTSYQVYLKFSNVDTVFVKRMSDNNEIIPVNGTFILEYGIQYMYSVVIYFFDRTEYYDAQFEVIAENSNSIQYSDIIKNVVSHISNNDIENLRQGYCQITENEPNNNTVSGAIVTYSDADNRGVISMPSDVDWWKIRFNYSGTANFWLGEIPNGCDYILSIYNSSGSTLLRLSNNSGNSPELITMDVVKGVYYTIKITFYSGINTSSQYLLRAKNYPSFKGNDVYKIKNYNYSSKYLSVNNGYNANGQNVLIDSEGDELSTAFLNNQRMRINYNRSVDAYVISPICSYNGNGRTIVVDNSGTVSAWANVHTWDAQDVSNQNLADAQYFTFEECATGIVIRMKFFSNFVLTANSSNDVYINTYSSSNTAQRWIITPDVQYNAMEDLYKGYGWGWMYNSGDTPTNLYLSSSYGKRFYNNSDEKHFALDIPANNSTPVYAATSGIVTQSGYKTDIQFFAVVKTDNNVYNDQTLNLRVLYQHMQQNDLIGVNETVLQSETQIGLTGQGHMHFCVITDGKNRLEAQDFVAVNNNTNWHTQQFYNTTNPLLFYDWNEYGFNYN